MLIKINIEQLLGWYKCTILNLTYKSTRIQQGQVISMHPAKSLHVLHYSLNVYHNHNNNNVLWSSGIGRKSEALMWDIARKRNVFLLFSIVLRILQLLVTYEPLLQFRGGFQQKDLSKWALQSNKKMKMSYVWLQTISPDCITCVICWTQVRSFFLMCTGAFLELFMEPVFDKIGSEEEVRANPLKNSSVPCWPTYERIL